MTVRAPAGTVSVLVIAKTPAPGRVKTRLCPPCTPREAAALAAASLADTLDAVAGATAARRLLVLDGEPGPWAPRGFEVIPQRGGGLDQRLAEAFARTGAPSFLVGMDTPQLSPVLIDGAIADLAHPGVDAVLGLAQDGGWWGIGLRRPDPRVFLGVAMSTPFTGAAQAARLTALGLGWLRLPILRDVDRFEDALAVAASIPTSRFGRVTEAVREAVETRSRAAHMTEPLEPLEPLEPVEMGAAW